MIKGSLISLNGDILQIESYPFSINKLGSNEVLFSI